MNTGQKHSRSRYQGSRPAAVLAVCWLLMLTALPPSAWAAADTDSVASPVELSINGTDNSGVTRQDQAALSLDQHELESFSTVPAKASAQDLSLFGILALGIIGLLWVRRHTSEL